MSFNFQQVGHGAVLTMFLILSAASVAAQGGTITGQVALPSGALLNENTRVTLQTPRGIKAIVFTDNQGRFQFRQLNAGPYEIVVEAADRNRFEITTASVDVYHNATSFLTITLKEKKSSDSKSAANSVSTTELDPAVPPKARKEFESASNSSKDGKTEEAIAHLRKAIEFYPSYLMAHNDLGVQLLAQGKSDEAEEELLIAIKIDPKAFNPKLNLGMVLVQQHRFTEAASLLKEAISLNSASPSARLYNGLALAALDDLEGAEQELKTSHDLGGSVYALALYHLGHVYLNKGDRKKAVEAFERYLNEAPKATNAGEVKALLNTIR